MIPQPMVVQPGPEGFYTGFRFRPIRKKEMEKDMETSVLHAILVWAG